MEAQWEEASAPPFERAEPAMLQMPRRAKFVPDTPNMPTAEACAAQSDPATTAATFSFVNSLYGATSQAFYNGMLHTMYSQSLKTWFNWLTIPLIIMNTVSSALAGASTSTAIPNRVRTGFQVATAVINIIAAVVVALQKFLRLDEKAGLHDGIQRSYFAYMSELDIIGNYFMWDDVNDIYTIHGMPVSVELLEKQQKKFLDLQKDILKLIPTVPVPAAVAKRLMPYIKRIQDDANNINNHRPEHLWNYPHALGIRSYLLEVPSNTGCCSYVVDGQVRWQCGSSCSPATHDIVQTGWECQCCGMALLQCNDLKAAAASKQAASAVGAEDQNAQPACTVGGTAMLHAANGHFYAPPVHTMGKNNVPLAQPMAVQLRPGESSSAPQPGGQFGKNAVHPNPTLSTSSVPTEAVITIAQLPQGQTRPPGAVASAGTAARLSAAHTLVSIPLPGAVASAEIQMPAALAALGTGDGGQGTAAVTVDEGGFPDFLTSVQADAKSEAAMDAAAAASAMQMAGTGRVGAAGRDGRTPPGGGDRLTLPV